MAVGVGHLGGLGRAAGEREGDHAEARGAAPPPIARVDARFKARNAHKLTRVAHKRRVRASNAETRAQRDISEPSSPLSTLIPLRFEFANEFRPREPRSAPADARRWRWPGSSNVRRPAAFRSRGVTPNRGENVAGRTGRGDHGAVAAGSDPRVRRLGDCRMKLGDLRERTGGSNTAALEPPSSSEATVLPNELAASPPGRCYRVASVLHRVTHRAEGGSQPEGPGSSPSRRHALITAWRKRPLKYGVPGVTLVSSTETSDPVARG